MKNKTLINLIILTLLSCNNDDKIESNFTIDNQPSEISEIKIFTKNGEVFDNNLILKLQQNQTLTSPNEYPLYKDLNGIKYSGKKVSTTFYNRTQEREIIDKGQYELWKNMEHINTTYWPYDMFKFRKLNYNLIYDEDFPNDIFSAREQYNDFFLVEKDGLDTYLPITIAVYIIHPYNYSKSYIYYENNIFEKNFVSSMKENDTIIVQSYKLKFIE